MKLLKYYVDKQVEFERVQEELKRAKGLLQSDVGAVGVGLDCIYGVR